MNIRRLNTLKKNAKMAALKAQAVRNDIEELESDEIRSLEDRVSSLISAQANQQELNDLLISKTLSLESGASATSAAIATLVSRVEALENNSNMLNSVVENLISRVEALEEDG